VTALAGRFEPTAGTAGLLTFEPRTGACAFLGYLTNLDEIVTVCGLSERTSAAAAVYELVRREGSSGIARLRGAFVVALWDDSHRTGLLATDHLGAGGLFYRSEGSGLLFGSEIRDVLDVSTRGASPERDAVIRWLANDAAGAGQTLYADVKRLGGGQLIEFADRSFRVRTYWRPTYVRAMAGTFQDHADMVREAAGAAVRRSLASEGGTGILLSGGLDSSSIAVFARGSGQSPVTA
jgi:asparagine synthase (glutamine-hydrolysing)